MKYENIKKIIWNLLDKTDISLLAYGSDGEEVVEEYVESKITMVEEDIEAEWHECGATKTVFSLSQLPKWVLKIPFLGCYDSASILEHLKDEKDVDFDLYIIDFCGASDLEDYCWDYCETETEIYELAKAAVLDDFFAGTFYLGDYKGVPVYISEKIIGTRCIKYESEFEHQKSDIERCENHFSDINAEYLLDKYGTEKINKLLDFIELYDICDLGNNNYRYDLNGNFKIIDYSSFRD